MSWVCHGRDVSCYQTNLEVSHGQFGVGRVQRLLRAGPAWSAPGQRLVGDDTAAGREAVMNRITGLVSMTAGALAGASLAIATAAQAQVMPQAMQTQRIEGRIASVDPLQKTFQIQPEAGSQAAQGAAGLTAQSGSSAQLGSGAQ